MNETDTKIAETQMPSTGARMPAGEPDPRLHDMPPAGTPRVGTFAGGEETRAEEDLEQRSLHPGSFASGVEEMPEENAEQRVYRRGGFAVGEETAPEQDAEARTHPGTFADSEPSA